MKYEHNIHYDYCLRFKLKLLAWTHFFFYQIAIKNQLSFNWPDQIFLLARDNRTKYCYYKHYTMIFFLILHHLFLLFFLLLQWIVWSRNILTVWFIIDMLKYKYSVGYNSILYYLRIHCDSWLVYSFYIVRFWKQIIDNEQELLKFQI